MRTDKPAATTKAAIKPSQIARSAHTLRLQMALDEAQRLARGERIKQLREESPYTQPALAELVGVTLRAYQRWEEGGGIEWDHLESLAEIHGVDVQRIHKGQERGPTPDLFAEPPYVIELREQLDRIEADLAALVAESDAAAALESEAREHESETKPPDEEDRRASSS